ncbi:hypothetical protein JTE90_029580 [Oedothorax gibbosus]|uniref:Uncharacterized protein n=1 Tax=Oedothorax gibbosus TaxID=931172 RepID=A0AAV6VDW3_9ARAC|nr:hypothetical protein JTE90_029580 [Oedothorax gibbosus]
MDHNGLSYNFPKEEFIRKSFFGTGDVPINSLFPGSSLRLRTTGMVRDVMSDDPADWVTSVDVREPIRL